MSDLTKEQIKRLRAMLRALDGLTAWEAGDLIAVAARLHCTRVRTAVPISRASG